MGKTGVDLEAQAKTKYMEDDIVLYTAKDIQRIFKCGQKKSYEIMHIAGFPAFRIDKIMYVEKTELKKWIDKNKTKSLFT